MVGLHELQALLQQVSDQHWVRNECTLHWKGPSPAGEDLEVVGGTVESGSQQHCRQEGRVRPEAVEPEDCSAHGGRRQERVEEHVQQRLRTAKQYVYQPSTEMDRRAQVSSQLCLLLCEVPSQLCLVLCWVPRQLCLVLCAAAERLRSHSHGLLQLS